METQETIDLLSSALFNLKYAAFNLCEKTDDNIEQGVVDSTCPETNLFIAIRQIQKAHDIAKK